MISNQTNPKQPTPDLGWLDKITIELTNNSAECLYAILVDYVEKSTSELKYRRILNKDGTRKKSRKYIGDYDQYLLDTNLVAVTLYQYLEPKLDTFKDEL